MKRYVRKITKEIYDRRTPSNYITDEDMCKVFDRSEMCGYGVYSPRVFEKNGEYFVEYELGDSCD